MWSIGNHLLVVEAATLACTGDRTTRPASKSSSLCPLLVSAPGKAIVLGEHAVVYGRAAIASAISLRSYLLVTPLSSLRRPVRIHFADIGLDHSWFIDELPWQAFLECKPEAVPSVDRKLMCIVQRLAASTGLDAKIEDQAMHRAAASAFLYMYLSLGNRYVASCMYAVRSDIPIGAGLGSSASMCVCIAAALLIQHGVIDPPSERGEKATTELEIINRWAFVGEQLIHGNPSGVDNTVATYGRAVHFKRTDPSKRPAVSFIHEFPQLPLLLVNTGQQRSTAVQVAKVAYRKTQDPFLVDLVLDAIETCTTAAYDIIGRRGIPTTSKVLRLGDLIDMNHALLQCLGVSHPKLERLRYLMDEHGVGWTKLTGAGGGGCAITLLSPEVVDGPQHRRGHAPKNKALQIVKRQVEAEGYKTYEAVLGGSGVGMWDLTAVADHRTNLERYFIADGDSEAETHSQVLSQEGTWLFWDAVQ